MWLTESGRQRELIEKYLVRNSAHTPKPEKMFEELWRKRIAYVQRRRGKPPRLVFVKEPIWAP
jgi:hypothetical protein